MSLDRPIAYVTFDGILTPLGHSQIVRVVTALARRGLPYIIHSAERAADLADGARVAEMRERLAEVGVEWHARVYDLGGTAAATARNLASGFTSLLNLVATRKVGLLHIRSYHSGMISHAVHRLTGTPYLFDARGYWIDERVAEGRWFVKPTPYRLAKSVEAQIYRRARAVVTLTDLQADDLRTGRVFGTPCAHVATITTAADFDAFTPDGAEANEPVPPAVRAVLADKQVIGLVGSLNGSYLADETARLCRAILAANDRAHLLVLSEQHAAYETLFARHQIPRERATLAKSSHEAMPAWLALIDWAPLILTVNFAKRASMPTKLGEFFAAGVRPIHYGCNSEVADWIQKVGTGLVLPSLDDAAFAAAARTVASTPRDEAALIRGREIARPHFGLKEAVDAYEKLLGEIRS